MTPLGRFESGTLYWESSVLTTRIVGKAYLKCKCPVFTNIKQKLHYKVATEWIWLKRHLFFMHCFPFLRWIKLCSACFRQVFFHLEDKRKWSLVRLDRWLCYRVTIVWELAWVDSVLVALDKWSSYRGGHISRFDCTLNSYLSKWFFFPVSKYITFIQFSLILKIYNFWHTEDLYLPIYTHFKFQLKKNLSWTRWIKLIECTGNTNVDEVDFPWSCFQTHILLLFLHFILFFPISFVAFCEWKW